MRRLIIEGITGTGKSTIYKKVVSKLTTCSGSNLFFLNEYITWRTFEKRESIKQSCEETFANISKFLKWLSSSYINADLQNTSHGQDEQPCYLMEGFHWNAYARGILSEDAFYDIENKLNQLNFTIVLLVLSDSQIKSRSVIETRQFRTNGWSKYLETLGDSDDKIAVVFKERQNKYCDIYSRSSLNKILINTDEKRWDDYVDRIITLGEMQ
jgi:adenylate kinase family enzyme